MSSCLKPFWYLLYVWNIQRSIRDQGKAHRATAPSLKGFHFGQLRRSLSLYMFIAQMWTTLKNTNINKIPVLKRGFEPRFQGSLLNECSKNKKNFIILKNFRNLHEIQTKTKQPSLSLPTVWPGNGDREAAGTRAPPGFRTPSSPNASDRPFPQGCHRDRATLLLTRVTVGAGPRGPVARQPHGCTLSYPHAKHTALCNCQVSSNNTQWIRYNGFLKFEGFLVGSAGDKYN